MGYFLKKNNIDNEGLVLPVGPTSERPLTPILASVRYNTDTNGIEYFNGTAYVEMAKTGRADIQVDKFIGDGATTIFTPMTVAHNDWTEVIVFINGIYQTGVSNYSVSGFTITFTSPPPNTMEIVIIHGLGSTYVQSADVFDVPNI